MNLASIIPFLPFVGVILVAIISAVVPFYLMRLQGSKLKKEIDQITQNISNGKTNESKEQVTTLEMLERVTATTAEELEKSLQRSITMRNLVEQVNQQQETIIKQAEKIEQLISDLALEHSARLTVESQVQILRTELANEKVERETAVTEIERLKNYSDQVIKKLTTRVKRLEEYIRKNNLPVPNLTLDTEEV